jgi:hypothetical protein
MEKISLPAVTTIIIFQAKSPSNKIIYQPAIKYYEKIQEQEYGNSANFCYWRVRFSTEFTLKV